MGMYEEKPKRGGSQLNTGALILIGIGVVFLLANLGILSGIGRLWPLVLVVIGVWMLMGRGTRAEINHEQFIESVGAAQSARVKLSLPVGETTIGPLEDSATLIDADMRFIGDMKFVAEGTTEKFISLSQTGESWSNWINPTNWSWDAGKELRSTILLNKQVAIDLDLNGGVGQSRIDLTALNLSALDINGGVGEIRVNLPASHQSLDARIRVGVGKLDLVIPSGAALNAVVKGGVGETSITLPVDAAVRIDASSGIGNLSITSRLPKVSGHDGDFGLGKKGVWESPNFNTADHKIIINYEGGVGQLVVR